MQTSGYKHWIVAAIVLLGGVSITTLTSRVRGVSEVGVKMDLPVELGGWHGHKFAPSPLEIKLLPAGTEFEKCAYSNDAQDRLDCSIVLSSPDDPRSIHRPELCLPTQGVKIYKSEPIQIPIAGLSRPLPVMVLHTMDPLLDPDGKPWRGTKGEELYVPAYFMYWFVGKDRVTSSHWQRTLWNMWDRTILSRNCRWAYIIVHGIVSADLPDEVRKRYHGRDSAETRLMLIDFTKKVFPAINLTTAMKK